MLDNLGLMNNVRGVSSFLAPNKNKGKKREPEKSKERVGFPKKPASVLDLSDKGEYCYFTRMLHFISP